jgi:hypothetical protein
MPMPERQPNNNNKPSRLSRISHSRIARYSVRGGVMAGVAGLAIAGGGRVHADNHSPILDSNESHTLQISNPNLANQIMVGGVGHEVIGLPQLRTALSSEVDADMLASRLGAEITFTVPEGSNVNDQIHNEIQNKLGADLSGSDTWKVVTEVGGSEDSLVYPGQVKTYAVNQEAVSTIKDANVEVKVPSTVAASTAEGSQTTMPNAEITVGCISTDLKGTVKTFTKDTTDDPHMSDNPVLFHFENVSTNPACPDVVYVDTFGSTQKEPNGTGWLESQHYIEGSQKQFLVPAGTTRDEWVNFPDAADCTYQMEALRTGEVRIPPTYFGNDMIDYAFSEDKDCIPTPTPTNAKTATPTATNTPEAPTATTTPTSTEVPGTATNTPSVECFDTDRKGTITYTGNHLSNNPVIAHLENVGKDPNCAADFYVDIFGSRQKETEGAGWLESQHLISQEKISVAPGTKKDISIDVPNEDDCQYQVDIARTDEKRADQLNGVKMIDYAFVKDVDSCLPATATSTATKTPKHREKTPTKTATVTATATVTSTATPENTPTATVIKEGPKLPNTGLGNQSDNEKSLLPIFGVVGTATVGASLAAWGYLRRKNDEDEDESTSAIVQS